ncbi:hypothetical protein DERP_011051 [Dermatophagoides pteronyssinus]|uniref:CCHC-type domain-containing protein n=1 Tax=Dermatophagoides pteronyssinus TaxID=6956 RepID=A0ABQ8J8P7_DERPT|nr:hypothetical protein DERP_011051 [Dermatophagoides pteronyssinus]
MTKPGGQNGDKAGSTKGNLVVEIKELVSSIRITEVRMFNQGIDVNHGDIKNMYEKYYQLCCTIIENDNIDKEIESKFNDAREKIDIMFKYSKLIMIIEQYLEKRTWTYNDVLMIDEKLPDLKAISFKYPYIITDVDKLIERIDRMKSSIDFTKSAESTSITSENRRSINDNNNVPLLDAINRQQVPSTSSNDQYRNDQPQRLWWDYGNDINTWSGGVKVAAKKLTMYNGEPLDYHKFKKSIMHYIIDNTQIRGNANKLMEIIDLLPSKDRYIIESLDPRTTTMTSVIDELDEYYANPNRLIPAIVNRIKRAPFISLRPSEKDWEGMLEVIILTRNTLMNAELTAEERSMVGILLQKIDRAHFMQIGDRRAMTLNQILEFVKTGLDRERMANSQIAASELASKPTNKSQGTYQRPTGNVMIATPGNACMFGDGKHRTAECPLSYNERRQIAIDKRLCFRCGGGGHNSRDCRREFQCPICGKNHIQHLCYDVKQSSTKTNIESNVNHHGTPKQMATSSNENNESSSSAVLLTNDGVSLFKTITTTINDRSVRIVLDDGSCRSFISKRLVKLWNLKTSEIEPIRVETLGQSSFMGEKSVSLPIPIWNGKYNNLDFRINDNINRLHFECISHDQQRILRNQGIDIMDQPGVVDILIGLDHINKIQLKEEQRISENVVAKRTTLGWIVYGSAESVNVFSTSNDRNESESTPNGNIDEATNKMVTKNIDNYGERDSSHGKSRRSAVNLLIIENTEGGRDYYDDEREGIEINQRIDEDQQYKNQLSDDGLEMNNDDAIESELVTNQGVKISDDESDNLNKWQLAEVESINTGHGRVAEIKHGTTNGQRVSYPLSLYNPCVRSLACTLESKADIHESLIQQSSWDVEMIVKDNQFVMKIIDDVKQLDEVLVSRFMLNENMNENIDLVRSGDVNIIVTGIVHVIDRKLLKVIDCKSKLCNHRKKLLMLSYGSNIAKSLEEIVRDKYGEEDPGSNKIYRIDSDEALEIEATKILLIIDETFIMKYGVLDIDFNQERIYDVWILSINAESDDWKLIIDTEADALKFLFKLNITYRPLEAVSERGEEMVKK